MTTTEYRWPCPVCAEKILWDAKECRFCHAMMTDADRAKFRQKFQTNSIPKRTENTEANTVEAVKFNFIAAIKQWIVFSTCLAIMTTFCWRTVVGIFTGNYAVTESRGEISDYIIIGILSLIGWAIIVAFCQMLGWATGTYKPKNDSVHF